MALTQVNIEKSYNIQSIKPDKYRLYSTKVSRIHRVVITFLKILKCIQPSVKMTHK